ncbi:MAG TPA: PPC domain-containing protein, partial [Gemmatimonadales bacterium]|nr:PPC domain-containing protein [Gemmatimonadales bacterium]
SDALSIEDLQFRDSTRFRRYVLPVERNQPITVDLESDDFDAFLILERGRGDRLARSDGGAGGCNARLIYRPADDRPLMVVVNTASRGQVGRFTLRVRAGAQAPEPPGPCRFRAAAGGPDRPDSLAAPPGSRAGPRVITVGQSVDGAVTTGDQVLPSDSTYAQAWTIEGRAGQTVTIDLRSEDFDPFLYLDGPGIERPLQDDDSGGNCNARLVATFPATGPYRIVVNTAVRNATGRFTLSVTSGSKSPSLARCARIQ